MSVECFPDKGVIKVFLKMSHEDFIYDYRFIINDDQNFDSSGKIDTTEIQVRNYLNNRVKLFAGDKLLKGQLMKIESANGEVDLSLLYPYNKRTKNFKVINTFLNDLNKDPSTLLIFKYKDIEQDVKLTQEKTEEVFLVK
jgi:hypothetical protein